MIRWTLRVDAVRDVLQRPAFDDTYELQLHSAGQAPIAFDQRAGCEVP